MFLTKMKPKTSSLRWQIKLYFPNIFNSYKYLFFKKKKQINGYSIRGKKLVWTKNKKKYFNYYFIDYKQSWTNQVGCIISYRYNYNLKKVLALIKYANGSLSLILVQDGLSLGNFIKTSLLKRYLGISYLGLRIPIRVAPIYSVISNIQLTPNTNGKYCKSNGAYAQILEHYFDLNLALIKLPTGKKFYISLLCLVSLGRIANIYKKYIIFGKAGNSLKIGKRFNVRGVAMNPVDHPHGGRTKTNQPEVSPWGWVTKHSH